MDHPEGMSEARGSRRKSPKMLMKISVEKAKNGGHVVTHHMGRKSPHGYQGMESLPDEQHVFGPEDGHAMLAHVGKHMGVEMPGEHDDEPEDGEEAEE